MKIQFILLMILLFASVSHAAVLDGCPSNNFQQAKPGNITVEDDGSLSIVTDINDEMRGRWGGQVRAEVNSKHIAHESEIFEYLYKIVIDDQPMNWPVVIFQLKQSGHSPTVALEWRNNRVYIKHRFSKNGKEHGPSMASRPIVAGKPMEWKIRVKPSHDADGFIEVYDGDELSERYLGPTLLPSSNQLHLKYGIYSFRFVDGINSRKLRVLDCQIKKIK